MAGRAAIETPWLKTGLLRGLRIREYFRSRGLRLTWPRLREGPERQLWRARRLDTDTPNDAGPTRLSSVTKFTEEGPTLRSQGQTSSTENYPGL